MINPYTRQRVPEAPADKRVLFAEIIYPFVGKPQHITMVPPLDDEDRAKVTLDYIAYHKLAPVIDFRYLGARCAVCRPAAGNGHKQPCIRSMCKRTARG